ncbi:conserved membrane hypothetical protein [anaerobic digester metagenome]|uniref:Uncharacterized protein n=1 Tax=anaerobic digester metagenome TaxID=1263854 RepID=A0A485M6D7_9ZZZZ
MGKVPVEVIYMDIFLYLTITIVVVTGVDLFAKFKLGKSSLGYMALKVQRYIAYLICSAATILFVVSIFAGLEVSQSILTFFGVPYFTAWVYYLTAVFRRLKAERIRRL